MLPEISKGSLEVAVYSSRLALGQSGLPNLGDATQLSSSASLLMADVSSFGQAEILLIFTGREWPSINYSGAHHRFYSKYYQAAGELFLLLH